MAKDAEDKNKNIETKSPAEIVEPGESIDSEKEQDPEALPEIFEGLPSDDDIRYHSRHENTTYIEVPSSLRPNTAPDRRKAQMLRAVSPAVAPLPETPGNSCRPSRRAAQAHHPPGRTTADRGRAK